MRDTRLQQPVQSAPQPRSLSLPTRAILITIAFLGTTFYAATFAALPNATHLFPLAAAIGISAGVSWPVLGLLLRVQARRRAIPLLALFDLCLIAMAFGEIVLCLAGLINLWHAFGRSPPAAPPLALHAALLILSNLVMFGVFARGTRRVRIPTSTAAGLWAAGLLLPFALAMALLARPLGYAQ